MTDHIKDQLDMLHEGLLRDAETCGEGPSSMTKSKFVSEMEKQSFISAYGQKAYDNLKD
jgi:hypothetical protein